MRNDVAARGLACSILLLSAGLLLAAEQPREYRGAVSGASVAARAVDIDLRELPLAREWEPGDPIKEIPRRGTHLTALGESAANARQPVEDALLERQAQAVAAVDRTFSAPLLSFAGQGFTGVNPPDTVGDVGPNHYIQMINHSSGTSVTVYGKSGSVLAGPFLLGSLGAGGVCASGFGDPVALYDSLADRWLLSEFAGSGNNLCVYVSKTSDPVSGGWFRYQFTTPNFPDYPKYAVWPDAYYVSSNENSPAVYALDRTRMLQGLSASFQRFTATSLGGFSFQALTPADLDGATPPPSGAKAIFMRHRDDEAHNPPGTAQDFLELWEFHVDWTTPANSTFTGPTNIAVSEFDSSLCGLTSFSCIPQPGTNTKLDPLREVIMFRLQYRNFGTHEALVGNLATDVNGADRAGIRWFELRKAGASWTLLQEGTYSPDAVNRWMGSVAMDGSGDIALGYSVSNSSTSPGIRYAGRLASDPAGTLPQGESILKSGSASNASNRWGDYAAMNVDPSDDCTFWFTTLYSPASTWGTWIGAFKFDACGLPPTPDFSIGAAPAALTVAAGASGNSTITVTSVGGFSSAVTLSTSALPSGVTASFSANPITPPGGGNASSTLTLSASAAAAPGTSTITITGTSGALSHGTSVALTVPSSAPVTVTFTSIAAQDGRILESSETSGVGGKATKNSNSASAIRIGDDASNFQYRSIVSFDTSSIPDGATIASAKLRLLRGTAVGTNPFTTHGVCQVDAQTGGFSGSTALEASDFQSVATAPNVASLSNAATDNTWSEATLNAAGLAAIDKTGTTQFRVYFTLDDNNDLGADFVGYYSGKSATAANRPQFVITYTP